MPDSKHRYRTAKGIKNDFWVKPVFECNVSLQSDIAIYWPGMHNTAFFLIFDVKLFNKRNVKRVYFLFHCCCVNVLAKSLTVQQHTTGDKTKRAASTLRSLGMTLQLSFQRSTPLKNISAFVCSTYRCH